MITSILKVRILDTTNEHVKKYIGEIRTCRMLDNKSIVLETPEHFIRTSPVVEITDDEVLIIKTKNSTYILEILEELKVVKEEEVNG